MGYVSHYLLVTSQSFHLAAANCQRPKQSLSNRAQSNSRRLTHSHTLLYFFPCTNTTSACPDTHLQHLVPVHAQQLCRLSLSPWLRSRGSFGSADQSEEERMRRESELELHFVTVIVTQCPLSLPLLKERKVLNSYCQLQQCVDLPQCRCLIEKPFKKQLVRKHVTFNNLCWQLVGTAPQIKFVSPVQVYGTTPNYCLCKGVQ